MDEKVLREFRVIETDDGFRIEIKGDKEQLRDFVLSLDPRGWMHGPFGGPRGPFGPGHAVPGHHHGRHGRPGRPGFGPFGAFFGWGWEDDEAEAADKPKRDSEDRA